MIFERAKRKKWSALEDDFRTFVERSKSSELTPMSRVPPPLSCDAAREVTYDNVNGQPKQAKAYEDGHDKDEQISEVQ
jgi:hypothetical protein